MSEIKTYSKLLRLPTFKQRFKYLKLNGVVGEETFGLDRVLNQKFYKSEEWKRIRHHVIVRDLGCDLGVEGREITGKILIHHMNPMTVNDVIYHSDNLLNPEHLITVSLATHNAIHYGDEDMIEMELTERFPNDTCPWKH